MNLNHIAKKPFFDLFYRSPCMAQILRAAYHDAGAFCKSHVQGGNRGALRFVAGRPEHSGLEFALEQIEEIKTDGNHITDLLSYADIIQLGGYAAVEYCGGPAMVFRMGRQDAQENEVSQESVNEPSGESVLQKMSRLGFSKQEFVALMGSHTIGFANTEATGPQNRWTMNPHVFDNSYFKEVLLGDRSKYFKSKGETLLASDGELRQYVEQYAQDE
jgi:catalase (peroxidase I)